jgi:ubiquinone biosynthesis protein UbiJ
MSPASYLTAPPRVAATIVATLVTIVSMWDWAIWGALVAAALAGFGAIALLVARVRQAWRAFKVARRHSADVLGELGRKGEETAEKAAAAGDTAELQESVARLRVSLARLAVLRSALDEAEEVAGRVTAILPRA